MDSQPKYKTQSANEFFYDRMTLQPPVPGTVAIGELQTDDVLVTGKDPEGNFVATSPLEATPGIIARGADRYGIYCAPCHRASGDGQGILFKRGVPTANLHDERLRAMPDGELFQAISNGVGLMPSYAYPISVEDRWAIVVYVRELQKGR
ncbi:MAG: cytochrome c [Acidobacteria bacterium]|nr:cytochrome c [Acidobacteriota bacterium]